MRRLLERGRLGRVKHRPSTPSPSAGAPNRVRNGPETMKVLAITTGPVLEKYCASCAFSLGAGDGNRTRTISLGS